MKHFIIILIAALHTNFLSDQENTNEVSIESKPKNVTVFLTGAELGHTNEVTLKKGKNLLKFTGLSSKMDQSSVVVDLENKSLVILSVFSHNNFLTKAENSPIIKSLKDTIDKVQDIITSTSGRIESYNKEKELLFKTSNYSTDENNVKKI